MWNFAPVKCCAEDRKWNNYLGIAESNQNKNSTETIMKNLLIDQLISFFTIQYKLLNPTFIFQQHFRGLYKY